MNWKLFGVIGFVFLIVGGAIVWHEMTVIYTTPWPVEEMTPPDPIPPTQDIPVTANKESIRSDWLENHTMFVAILAPPEEEQSLFPNITCNPEEPVQISRFDPRESTDENILAFELEFQVVNTTPLSDVYLCRVGFESVGAHSFTIHIR